MTRVWVLIGLLPALSVAAAPRYTQPAIQRAWAARVRYENRPGEIFIGHPTGHEVLQGKAGVCALLSALAGLARAHPSFVESSLLEVKNAVKVRFFRRDRVRRTWKAVYQVVDRALPRHQNDKLLNARSRNERAQWVSLVEKAYAKFKRHAGYDGLNLGGYPQQALTALSGKPARTLHLTETTADSAFRALKAALDRGVAVASTFDTATFRTAASRDRLERSAVGAHILFRGDRRRPSYAGTGLWPGHAYTVWRVFERDAKRWVQVRDPYGETPAVTAPWGEGKDGILTLPLGAFTMLFDEAHVVSLPQGKHG
jgi:hypothetical protein